MITITRNTTRFIVMQGFICIDRCITYEQALQAAEKFTADSTPISHGEVKEISTVDSK